MAFKMLRVGFLEETSDLLNLLFSTVFPNVPSQPGMPCQGEDSEYTFHCILKY